MSFGFDRQERVFMNNTKMLTAVIYDKTGENLIPQASISSVRFTIVKPGDDPVRPSINEDLGSVEGDGTGVYVVAASVNDIAGTYHAIATFTYIDDAHALTRSIPVDYDVADPFERTGTSPADGSIRQGWMKLEGCFDSEIGGPWLRDMAIATRFDQSTLRGLLPEVLLAINQQMPFTDYTEAGFPYGMSDGEALLAEGLLVSAIRHLLRSYTEQPLTTGSPVAFVERRDYQQRWQTTLQIEQAQFDKWLKQWKLRAYDITHASVLLGTKAGRLLPAPMRTRNFGRGY